MLRHLGLVLSISLADSLNPGTIGPALFLAGGESPRRRVLGFTAGTFAVFLLGGLILTLGPGRAILALVPHPDATTRYILETAAGAAMLIVGGVVWRRRERIQRRARDSDDDEPGRMASSAQRNPVLLGATLAVVELPTAFPYFAAIAAIVGSGTHLTHQILLVVIYNLVFVLPLLVIVLMLSVLGERTVGILSAIRRWARGRWPTLVGAVALLAGAFVITLGVTGLTGRASGTVGHVSRRLRRIISR
jgi:cytochrome c biogenesis protein CcdA